MHRRDRGGTVGVVTGDVLRDLADELVTTAGGKVRLLWTDALLRSRTGPGAYAAPNLAARVDAALDGPDRDDLLDELHHHVAVAIVEAHPGTAVTVAMSAGVLAGPGTIVLNETMARWPRDDARWDDVLHAMDQHGSHRGVVGLAKALSFLPEFPIDRVGDVVSFDPALPDDAAARAAWPAQTVQRALAFGHWAIGQPVRDELATLPAGRRAAMLALAPDWPGTWGELARAAALVDVDGDDPDGT